MPAWLRVVGKAIPWKTLATLGAEKFVAWRRTRKEAAPARCARCGGKAASSIHATTSTNDEIRAAAHAFEPAPVEVDG